MMGGLAYIRASLAGAWQVMLGRPDGLRQLDITLEGFWRSFGAVFLLAPFALPALMSQRQLAAAAGEELGPLAAADIAVEGIALVADWLAFPLVFALLARPFGLGAGYVPFIVTRNWASVIVAAMVGLVHALHVVGLLPPGLTPILLLVALAVALRFSYIIARTTLGVSMALALPIVVLDFLISLMVWSAVTRGMG
jgi:hypothetical protein